MIPAVSWFWRVCDSGVSLLIPALLLVAPFTACTRRESVDRLFDGAETAGVTRREAMVDDSTVVPATVDSLVAGTSCSPPVEREWYDPPDPDQQLFLESGIQWGASEADIVRRLGPPFRIEVDTTRNIHTGEPDELRKVQYPGLEFYVYRVLELEREIIYRVDVDGDQYRFAFGFGVGSPWQEIQGCLGEPSAVEGSAYQYAVGEAEELITFWVTQGVVQRIRWEFYID